MIQKKQLIFLALVLLYMSAYIFFRVNHQIIHRTANAGDVYTKHWVTAGDAPLIGSAINSGISIVFTPLRLIELAVWHIVQPLGSKIHTS